MDPKKILLATWTAGVLVWLASVIGVIYVVSHFVQKFW